MKPVAIALLLFASLCCTRECYPQDAGDFHPATTNVWGAEYPRVDSAGRAQIRVRAPDATKVKVNFWSGPKSGHAAAACSRIALLHRNYRWSGSE